MRPIASRRTALVVAAGVMGAVSPVAPALAAQPEADAAQAAYVCRNGAVTASDLAGSAVPTARRAGVALHARIRVHNAETVKLAKASYVFAVGNLLKTRGPAPLVQWRVGTGHWHKASLHWNSKTNGSLPLWNSTTLSLGTIPARGSVVTELSVTFPKKSVKAVDHDFLEFHSGGCGTERLGWYEGNGFEYWPWTGTPGKPV
ncbi:hypothetical protein SAMN06272781_8048 [Streptomyces sp. 1222.2]|uniref:hypothetical protein n=1 Tax=Streptomyces TaxID=1883 RepID=UPI000BCBA9D1|nr:hypothetical protein [Streptomyces sp. 1222.2]SOD83153.1 hypothetical protein SAMN06272781_8048 [Streptomyces sp. 1222.2]